MTKEKKRTIPKTYSIGRPAEEDPGYMYPNDNYAIFFPEEARKIEENSAIDRDMDCDDREIKYVYQEWVVKTGLFIVINCLLDSLGLRSVLEDIFSKESSLFLDLVTFTIATEDNAIWNYYEYAREHALFSNNMRIASDAEISAFQNNSDENYSQIFLDAWINPRDKGHRIWVCYDFINNYSQSCNDNMFDCVNEKDEDGKSIIPCSVVYDLIDKKPIYYELYPGSMAGASQLEFTIETMRNYGYYDAGFIVDRGFLSSRDIKYLESNGYAFIIKMKGSDPPARSLILEVKNSFEWLDEHYISAFDVNGITVKHKIYDSDDRMCYFHIYYSVYKVSRGKSCLYGRLDGYEKVLTKNLGKKYEPVKDLKKYFNLSFDLDNNLLNFSKKSEIINEEIADCGYYVIITSEEMTAKDALFLYKGRDPSEMIFRMDKSRLGNCIEGSYTSQGVTSKMLETFVALILRNELYVKLQEWNISNNQKLDYMNVPKALKVLEGIKIVRTPNYVYRMCRDIGETERNVLSAFGISPADAKRFSLNIGKYLRAAAKDVEK